jgi:hypothetical protein
LNREEKAFARTIFKIKVLSANGQAYEDLFCEVLSNAYPDFLPIKPKGKVGDRKNDGYIKSSGRYFQVYAPEDPKSKDTEKKAIQKAEGDFSGLKDYWQKIYPIEQYYFVFNDKYHGSTAELEKTLKNIKSANKLKAAGVFLAKHLEDTLFTLSDDIILSIVGHIPDLSNFDLIDFHSLREVISYILTNHKPLSAKPVLVVPGFDEKIEFNGLSKRVKNLLNSASYQIGTLDEYFYKNGATVKQELRDILSEKYKQAQVKDFGDTDGVTKGDLIFFDILNSLVPKPSASIENAAIVLMTKYFEACDIFEDPGK